MGFILTSNMLIENALAVDSAIVLNLILRALANYPGSFSVCRAYQANVYYRYVYCAMNFDSPLLVIARSNAPRVTEALSLLSQRHCFSAANNKKLNILNYKIEVYFKAKLLQIENSMKIYPPIFATIIVSSAKDTEIFKLLSQRHYLSAVNCRKLIFLYLQN